LATSPERLAYNRAYYAANQNSLRWKRRLHRHGLTIEQYRAMWDAQAGHCAICAVELVDIEQREGRTVPDHCATIDHCHKTGKVRGLLCRHCNLCIGYARDSIATLVRAIDYLGKQ
jgi:hypothetical protein